MSSSVEALFQPSLRLQAALPPLLKVVEVQFGTPLVFCGCQLNSAGCDFFLKSSLVMIWSFKCLFGESVCFGKLPPWAVVVNRSFTVKACLQKNWLAKIFWHLKTSVFCKVEVLHSEILHLFVFRNINTFLQYYVLSTCSSCSTHWQQIALNCFLLLKVSVCESIWRLALTGSVLLHVRTLLGTLIMDLNKSPGLRGKGGNSSLFQKEIYLFNR